MSFRELLWMSEGKSREVWKHTAHLSYYTYHAPGVQKPMSISRFDPYHRESQGNGIPWTVENNEVIIRAFTQR